MYIFVTEFRIEYESQEGAQMGFQVFWALKQKRKECQSQFFDFYQDFVSKPNIIILKLADSMMHNSNFTFSTKLTLKLYRISFVNILGFQDLAQNDKMILYAYGIKCFANSFVIFPSLQYFNCIGYRKALELYWNHMQNRQVKLYRQSISLMKLQNEQIFQYANQWGNHTLICARYIDFNKNLIKHDRGSIAYCTSFTSDALFAVIFVKDPSSVQVLNLKSGQIFVARGFEQFISHKVLSVSVQPGQGMKAGQNTRKINVIFQNRGSIYFKIIQMAPKVDNDPKSRTKAIEQNQSYRMSTVQCPPVFSTINWNNFIFCRKQMRVCKALNKNDEITFNFAVQAFQPQLNQLFARFNIIATAQTTQSWAILCGNALNSRNDENMVLNIFWQHQQGNQLSRNMYFKDASFIKSVDIPATEKQLVRFWHMKSFYLIQVQGSNYGSHKLYVISELLNYAMMTLDLSQNSAICPHSLTVNTNELSICQVVNKNELLMVKLCQNEPHITNAMTNISNPNSQEQTEAHKTRRSDVKLNQTSIKPFIGIQEHKISINQTQKNTVKKTDTLAQEPKVELTKKLINQKIVQHLTKADKGVEEPVQQQLQVPNQLESLISFGASGTIDKKNVQAEPGNKINQTNKSETLLSFGTPQTAKITTQSINNNRDVIETKKKLSEQEIAKENQTQVTKQLPSEKNKNIIMPQKKQKLVATKKQAKQILQFVQNFSKIINDQFNLRHAQIQKNYSSQPMNQSFKLEPVFSKQQQRKIVYFSKTFQSFQLSIKNKNIQNQISKKNEMQNKLQIDRIIQNSSSWLIKLRINQNEELPQIKNLRKFSKGNEKKKTFRQQISADLFGIQYRVSQIFTKSNEILTRHLIESKTRAKAQQQQKASLGLKQITEILNKPKQKYKQKQKTKMKIPIPRSLFVSMRSPIICLPPL